MAKLLIADDSKGACRLIRRMAEALGHRAIEAYSGAAALRIAIRECADLIFLDWHFDKGADGMRTLGRLRSHPLTKDIPVIMMSGVYESPAHGALAEGAGAEFFLTKKQVFDRRNLAKCLDMLLEANRKETPGRIIVLEDDAEFAELVAALLTNQGHEVWTTDDPRRGLKRIRSADPDLVILDLTLPGMDGLEICRRLKESPATRPIPILILTARTSKHMQRIAARYRADHYMTKPLEDVEEFLRWVAALLRRKVPCAEGRRLIEAGGSLKIDLSRHTVTIRGVVIEDMPAKSFSVLCELANHAGETLKRSYLIRRVWNNSAKDREVDKEIGRLKTHLGAYGERMIECVRGEGYRLVTTASCT